MAEADASLRKISLRIDATLGDVVARAARGEATVAIDIPIGLATGQRRAADSEARRRLGAPRASSVFSAPSRAALAATTHREACDLNEAACGRRLSQQSFGILKKIREVDALMSPPLQSHIREAHPEVAFAEISGAPRGLLHAKKRAEGRDERLAILRAHLDLPDIEAAYRALGRKNVERDDIIDALVCLITAQRIARGQARTFPAAPEYDDRGLRMEIVA